MNKRKAKSNKAIFRKLSFFQRKANFVLKTKISVKAVRCIQESISFKLCRWIFLSLKVIETTLDFHIYWKFFRYVWFLFGKKKNNTVNLDICASHLSKQKSSACRYSPSARLIVVVTCCHVSCMSSASYLFTIPNGLFVFHFSSCGWSYLRLETRMLTVWKRTVK